MDIPHGKCVISEWRLGNVDTFFIQSITSNLALRSRRHKNAETIPFPLWDLQFWNGYFFPGQVMCWRATLWAVDYSRPGLNPGPTIYVWHWADTNLSVSACSRYPLGCVFVRIKWDSESEAASWRIRNMGSGVKLPGFLSWPCYLQAGRPRGSPNPLLPPFLICKMVTIIPTP